MEKKVLAFDALGGRKEGIIKNGLFFQSPNEVPFSVVMESEEDLIVPSNVYSFKEGARDTIYLQEKIRTTFVPYYLTKSLLLAENDYRYGIITSNNYEDFLQSKMSYSNYELSAICDLLHWAESQKERLLMCLLPYLHLNLEHFTICANISSAIEHGDFSKEEGMAALKGYTSLWMQQSYIR